MSWLDELQPYELEAVRAQAERCVCGHIQALHSYDRDCGMKWCDDDTDGACVCRFDF